jgi:tetratricopeptide (TPR) repeat protein
MSETCPSCGAPASGKFCNQCGAALSAACRECGNPLPRGARFCNQCGAAVSPRAAPAGPARPWLPWVAGGIAAAAVLALAVTLRPRREEPAPLPPPAAAAPAPMPAGDPAAVDLSTMTPREAADRLFNRVMTAASQGDSAQARRFVPMALQAAAQVQPQDNDLRYHVASLHLVGGDWSAARAEADALLAQNPKHLFALFVAAQAEDGRGNAAGARGFYRRFLEAYDGEAGRDVPEYNEHRQALPVMRDEARTRAGG